MDVDGVKVAALEVLVEYQDLLFVNEVGQFCLVLPGQVVLHVLRGHAVEVVKAYQVLKVVTSLGKVLRTVPVVDLVTEKVRVFRLVYSGFH